ncbi:MAG: type II toxin-antitoxin system VapB family antitoxin [Ancrocorticia populi]|uniref:type II toxin-antitoxin system VapB family antitoxin n=1 Tax=Ancrocorticia populi TaxID=2175228 RepID=UPI003F9042F5
MTTMNIKDPRVHELARELAAIRGSSATAAVRQALEETLGRERREGARLADTIGELQERASKTMGEWIDEASLYDEVGLPK